MAQIGGGGLAHSQIQTWEHFVRGRGLAKFSQSQMKNVFYYDPKKPNNPPNLCDNNNIMKVTPLICSPESQNND